jgi:hypothetical protein
MFFLELIQFFDILLRCVNHYIFSEEDCHIANGTFHYPSISEATCSSYVYCWTPESIVTGILSPLDSNQQCPDGGIKQSLFHWEKAKWIGGTWAFTNWTIRQAVPANELRVILDFPHLQSVVSSPADLSVKTYLQNEVLKFCN